ncbi:MAG TPA: DHHA1 domain-containing protein [Planctomycetota bacterium]|nr:DHHA1 domain-containing protein [Planctomycetota bacterium]
MTERLYYLDPYLKEFTATVVKKTDKGVVLDRTAFFPTGGGQPCDLGTLNGVEVTDVIEDGNDVIHAVASPLDGEVRGVIDWDRRRDHMQQHHGQHLLSEAFVRVAKAQTSSFHLGRQGCSIDLDQNIAPVDIERAETLTNMVIYENRPVQIGFFGHDEARNLPMRKPPPLVEERIRVVTVNEYDCQACCGTHPRTTGEVGVVCITGVERQKGTTRVHFLCGYRALNEARENARILKAIGQKLSAGRDDLEKAVDRVMTDFAEARRQLGAAERKLAEQLGRELAARGRVVVEVFEGRGIEYLRSVATAVATTPGKVAILGGTGETSSVVVARSADLSIDLRPIFKDVLAPIQGKGGGTAHFVQGGGPGADVRAALKVAEEKILANLGA